MSSKITLVPAQAVRDWATEQGISEGFGSRGRLSTTLIDKFNAVNKGARLKHEPKAFKSVVTVKGFTVSAKGRKTPVTRTVNVKDARATLVAQGVDVGTRGRLSSAALAQSVGLVTA